MDVNWNFIGSIFDKYGRIDVWPNKNGEYFIQVRISLKFINDDMEITKTQGKNQIQEFMGYAFKKNEKCILVYRKNEVRDFLINIKDYSVIKSKQVDYLLNNYNFNAGIPNTSFNIKYFREIEDIQTKIRRRVTNEDRDRQQS